MTELALAGSYRRGCAMIGDLDVVAVAAPPGAVIDGLAADPEVARVLARGTTRATVLLRSGLQVDLRAVGRESFGAALHYFTGSKSHNIAVRRLGAALGLKVNEYGVFRGARRVAGDTEASVYAALGLPFIPPELREDQGEIEAAREGRLPRLIEAGDLRGDLVIVPPSAEIEALVDAAAAAARAQGRDYLVVLHVIGAQPRPPRELRARVQAAARTARLRRVALLQGAEIDLVHGARAATPLDFTAGRVAVAGEASVRAALHRLARGRPALVRVVARPDGRDAPVDLEGLVAAARGAVLATDDAPEHFLWLERLFRAARREGTTLLIGTGGETDAARLEQVLSQARRAGLTAGSVGNTRPLAELGAALRKARGRPAASTTRARAVDRESSRAP